MWCLVSGVLDNIMMNEYPFEDVLFCVEIGMWVGSSEFFCVRVRMTGHWSLMIDLLRTDITSSITVQL